MDEELYNKAALVFLKYVRPTETPQRVLRSTIGEVSFQWDNSRISSDPSYEFLSGIDWAVSRVQNEKGESCLIIRGNEDVIVEDLDRCFTLGILSGDLPTPKT